MQAEPRSLDSTMRTAAQIIGWIMAAINALGVLSGLVVFIQSDLEGKKVRRIDDCSRSYRHAGCLVD